MSVINEMKTWMEENGKYSMTPEERAMFNNCYGQVKYLAAKEAEGKPEAPASLVEWPNILKGKWYWGLWKPETKEEALQWYGETLDKGSGLNQHLVLCGEGDEERIIAITGNGPHSADHARAICALPDLMSRYRPVPDRIDELLMELRAWRDNGPFDSKDAYLGKSWWERFDEILAKFKGRKV